MTDETAPVSLKGLSDEDWLLALDDIGEERGHFEPIGPNHSAIFTDRDPVLLVTFETRNSIRSDTEDQLPVGFQWTEGTTHSHLCILADSESWFRDKYVFGYFDRLVDDGFFDDFDKVVFYGVGMCGYAAAAFSVVAPGATVIAVDPVATLDPSIAGWDTRHKHMRRTSFTDRYGYAPDMLEAASDVYIMFDPAETLNAMHAALFTSANVTTLPCRRMGPRLEHALNKVGIIEHVVRAACDSNMATQEFWSAYRNRRNLFSYERTMLSAALETERPKLAAMVCRSVTNRRRAPHFAKTLRDLEEIIGAVETA
ncbi:phosphoadenosine phosphosulfate reductase [Cochlodiniinecator piscidefendens]|uniref:phosphoadenosine phosphosulfate reductase n=1 Tax=Cochlodiniinecator piscidefendens TaxID=2715756 RepID=UPI00140B1AA8|nr:phosphoadenosine phosphosulfate reductase [Cochlodiniinecator piscidefendens]